VEAVNSDRCYFYMVGQIMRRKNGMGYTIGFYLWCGKKQGEDGRKSNDRIFIDS